MATITRENLGTLHDKITVKLAKEDYMPAFEKKLTQFAKTANIPGFRKGMVPAGMLRKMQGQTIINEEVVRKAGFELENFMRAEKLIIFGQPMIMPDAHPAELDYNNPKDIELAFEIGIKPEFEIPAIKNPAKLTAYKILVTDAMLDDEMERIQRRFGNVSSQETVVNPEDVIFCNLQPSDAAGNPITEGKLEETVVLGRMPTKLQDLLLGKTAGTTLVINPKELCTDAELPKFLKDPLRTNAEHVSEHYLLTINKVGVLMPMESGFELYAKVFPNDMITEEKVFREKVREEIQREFDRLGRERFHNEIFELLVHTTPITLPVTFLMRWLKEGGEVPKTELEVEHGFSAFEHQLRWQLISDKIISENRIGVTKEEVTTDIRTRVLAYYGMDADEDAPWLAPYMEKVMKDDKMVDETFRRILTDRIFRHLENQFHTELKEVDEEAFFKLPNAHAAYHHHH